MMSMPTSVTKRNAMRHCVLVVALLVPAILYSQEPLPRFRAGTNLVRVDAYVSKDQVAITDLTVDDFRVFEDDKPQKVEAFEVVHARAPVPKNERRDATSMRDMRQEVRDAARVFTLFFDPLTVSFTGSYHVKKPLIETLDKMIGPDDLVGWMTPAMSPSAITYSRTTGSIEQFVSQKWPWGERDQALTDATPQEQAIIDCYDPFNKMERDIPSKIIARLRERRTLDALDALVTHLDGLRPERKFVMVFTEGWQLFLPDPGLARVLEGRGPRPDPLGVDPATGKLRPQGSPNPVTGAALTDDACERLRIQVAEWDHERDFLTLLQKANRANVSFYPIDARGLIVYDQPTNFNMLPSNDQTGLRHRYFHLENMAAATDGVAVLNSSNVGAAMQRIFTDVGSYYLLSYYSTNQRLDGRFRRIRVEVTRRDVDVRARNGYLAPTEAEVRSASALMDKAEASRAAIPVTVSRALDSLAPTRGSLPVRIQASGGPGSIGAIVEIDSATLKQREWMTGGTMRVSFEPDAAGANRTQLSLAIEPGQRSIIVSAPEVFAAGKYVVRAELTPKGSRAPLQVSTPVEVVAEGAGVGSSALAYRRGPSTGLAYVPTADARFRRTERLRIEVPVAGDHVAATGRLLTRDGRPMPLSVTYQVRRDEAQARTFGVGEVILSPLAAGEYVLELAFTIDGTSSPVAYGFRIVP